MCMLVLATLTCNAYTFSYMQFWYAPMRDTLRAWKLMHIMSSVVLISKFSFRFSLSFYQKYLDFHILLACQKFYFWILLLVLVLILYK